MTNTFTRRLFLALSLIPATAALANVSVPLNDDWKFIRRTVAGAFQPTTDVSSWDDITLPHT